MTLERFLLDALAAPVGWAEMTIPSRHHSANEEAFEQPDAADPCLESELVSQARLGDRPALERLVKRHQAAVTRLLWRFVRTSSDLEDLTQDTFLRMLKGLPGWRAEQPFSHWLLRIAANTGRDYCRRQTVRRRWTVDSGAETNDDGTITFQAEAVDPQLDPAARAAANEIKTLMERLPADDRTLLTLQYLEGWGLPQIAAQFGWTHTATKLRAWRARKRLRNLLSVTAPDDSSS